MIPSPAVLGLPRRPGPRPRTTPTNPHQQLDQNAPPPLQEALFRRAVALPGVITGPSLISVPGARALFLPPDLAGGPSEAFLIDGEFGHLHPPADGSLHLALAPAVAAEVVAQGWGEPHPVARLGLIPQTVVMVYGPRDQTELEIVWQILETAYLYARGAWRSTP
mgnify:FL=1